MRINRSTYSNYMRQVCRDLFIKDTVSDRPHYINSTSMQRRKPLRAQGKNRFSGQKGIQFLDKNIKEFPNFFEIGPYELELLNLFTNCQDGYLFFRGGSRSGKSSSISFLSKYCEKYYDEVKDLSKSFSFFNSGKTINSIKFLQVDCGNYDSGLRENKRPNEELVKLAFSKFILKLCRMIIAECSASFEKNSFFNDQAYIVFKKSKRRRFKSDIFSEIILRLRNHSAWPSEEEWNTLPNDKKEQIVNLVLGSCDDPTDHLIGTIAPIWYYSNSNNSPKGKNVIILVIDNIDPQPTYFQQKIAERIRALCTTQTWSKYFKKNHCNIIVPVRLSTYKRRIGQLGGSFASVEHESFYPSDVIFYRLNYFFLTEGKFTRINKFHDEYQKAIIMRLYALWSHMSDINGYFRTMIDSLSGTNLNHANGFAQNWCMCTNFEYGNYDKDELKTIFYSEIKNDSATALLNELWFSILRSMQWCLNNYYDNTQKSIKKIKKIAVDCVRIFSITVGEIFRDNRILCYPNEKHTIGTRRQIAYCLIDSIIQILTKQINSNKKNEIALKHANDFGCIIGKKIKDETLCIEFINSFYEEVENNLLLNLSDQCCMFSGYNEELAGLISEWVTIVLESLKTNFKDLNIDKPLSIKNDDALPYQSKSLSKCAPKISRFDAGWHLLQPKDIMKEDLISAENVFCPFEKKIRPVAMHILYILYYSTDYSIATGNIIDLLKNYGYDYKNEIIPVMQNLVRIDRRLIFCDVNDYEYGINNILKERNMEIFLSNAGKSYFENLIIAPPYLQWALRKTFSKKQLSNVVEKVQAVFIGIKNMILSEIKSIQEINSKPESYGPVDEAIPDYLCASLDIIIRSLDHYIPSLIAHHRNIGQKNEMLTKTEKLISDIVLFSKKQTKRLNDLFFNNRGGNQTFIKWQDNLSWSEKHLSEKIGLNIPSID